LYTVNSHPLVLTSTDRDVTIARTGLPRKKKPPETVVAD